MKFCSNNIKITGKYEFYIDRPEKFFARVIGLRKYYSKQELIEQIRIYIIKSIETRIEVIPKEFYIDIEMIKKILI